MATEKDTNGYNDKDTKQEHEWKKMNLTQEEVRSGVQEERISPTRIRQPL